MDFNEGLYLTIDEVKDFIKNNNEKNRVILIAGLHNSGKTTLITSIYEYFQRGMSKYPYFFAGSRTLIEFEKLCFSSRAISDGNNQSERTQIDDDDEENFVHLKVRDKYQKKPACNIFMTDFPGEKFKDINSYDSKLSNMRSLQLAHHIVFLVNGEDLIDNINLYTDTRTIVRNILNYIHKKKLNRLKKINYHLLITKWDTVENIESNERDRLIRSLHEKTKELNDDFKEQKYKVRLIVNYISARPSKKNLLIDRKIVHLLTQWIEK